MLRKGYKMQWDEYMLIQIYNYENLNAVIRHLFCGNPSLAIHTHVQNRLTQMSTPLFAYAIGLYEWAPRGRIGKILTAMKMFGSKSIRGSSKISAHLLKCFR